VQIDGREARPQESRQERTAMEGNAAATRLVPPGAGAQQRAAVQGRQRRVLIVEDEAMLRRVIARNLASRGYLVREAGTAAEALGAVVAECPDLLLLDINLPDRSGWDVLREIQARGLAVPTVVVSAVRASPGRLAEFRPLAYLPKPFPLDALLRLVEAKCCAPSAES
jgi:CheY-like chemotaxis protein